MNSCNISIIDRTEEIIDPNLSNVDKIGRMTRLCYRTEPKDGEDQHSVNIRIIKHCIESGHESVLEHGIMSVFINPEVTEDSQKITNYLKLEKPTNLQFIWNMCKNDAASKYIEQFYDPELHDKFAAKYNVDKEQHRVLPTYAGDVRAWRQTIRERIYINTSTKDLVGLALTLKVLQQLDASDADHVLFADIVEDVNERMLKDENIVRYFQNSEYVKFEKGEPITIDAVCDKCFKCTNSVFAGQSSACASLSVILTTDRAVTHQLVRHRKNVAYSQESQRYVNYDKKGAYVVPLTVEPSKYVKWCEDNHVSMDDLFADYDTGRLNEECDAVRAHFNMWISAVSAAFNVYHDLLKDTTGSINLPTETARGVLPNDTATRIGVTWFRSAAFINLCFWRLEAHAQYSIRSMIARVVYKMFASSHPFCMCLPHHVVMGWFNQMKEQKLFKDEKMIDDIIERQTKLQEAVSKYVKEHMNKTSPEK